MSRAMIFRIMMVVKPREANERQIREGRAYGRRHALNPKIGQKIICGREGEEKSYSSHKKPEARNAPNTVCVFHTYILFQVHNILLKLIKRRIYF